MPEWIAKNTIVKNSKTNDEQYFKWTAIAAWLHKEIEINPERKSKLENYEDQYDQNGLECSLAIQKIDLRRTNWRCSKRVI